jgi:3-isopropylmalate dehydrogenase
VIRKYVVSDIASGYPSVRLEHMYVDACAMAIALEPRRFDIVLTENLFGDILSDEAGAVVGSLGLLPSASWVRRRLMAGPRQPDLAGGHRQPGGAILSAAMMPATLQPDREQGERRRGRGRRGARRRRARTQDLDALA